MEMDKKEAVLLALYAEYTQNVPDMRRVNAETMRMEKPAFRWALMKLKIEGLVSGVEWAPDWARHPDDVKGMNRDRLMLTGAGVRRAESLAGIVEDNTPSERRTRIVEMLSAIGCGIAANMIWNRMQ